MGVEREAVSSGRFVQSIGEATRHKLTCGGGWHVDGAGQTNTVWPGHRSFSGEHALVDLRALRTNSQATLQPAAAARSPDVWPLLGWSSPWRGCTCLRADVADLASLVVAAKSGAHWLGAQQVAIRHRGGTRHVGLIAFLDQQRERHVDVGNRAGSQMNSFAAALAVSRICDT